VLFRSYVRGIDDNFVSDLNSSILNNFLCLCKKNDYSLEIRKDYVNVYYKGGNAIKITQLIKGYSFYFDLKYCLSLSSTNISNKAILSNLNNHSVNHYWTNIKLISDEMDAWFKVNPNPERDFQHTLTKNTHSNFQIIDIEYAIRDMNIRNRNIINGTKVKELFRLDMLASYEQDGQQKLIIVENKYGDNLGGSSGVKQHLDDINFILNNAVLKTQLISSVNSILDNKQSLGLINNINRFDSNSTIEVLFILANYSKGINVIQNIANNVKSNFVRKAIIIPVCTNIKNYTIDYSRAVVI